MKTLVRDRLFRRGDDPGRVVLVVAPAGWGKSVLLGHLSDRGPAEVVRRSATEWRRNERAMLHDLQRSLPLSVTGPGPHWRDVVDAVRGLRDLSRPACLVVDDLQELEGSRAESDLIELARAGPPALSVLLASRTLPSADLSRLRAGGELVELGTSDLRFRSWEIEQLFRDVYGESLSPEEAAALARRTDGWPACIHLFHLAAGRQPAGARRALLASLTGRSAITRDYLSANVIVGLPSSLRRFLVEVSVLGYLTPALCDELLDRSDSAELVEDLARRQLVVHDPRGGWTFHALLRERAEALLEATLGSDETSARYRKAASLLEREGMIPEALRAALRGDTMPAACRLAWRHGRALADRAGRWVEPMPADLVDKDAWSMTAWARWLRAEGRPRDAIEAYRRAEAAFGTLPAARVCRRERAALASWLEPLEGAADDWSGVLLSTLSSTASQNGRAESSRLHTRLSRALADLATGEVARAIEALDEIPNDAHASEAVTVAARVAVATARMLAGDAAGRAAAREAVEETEALDIPWLTRLARATCALSDDPDGLDEAKAVMAASERLGDPVGAMLAALLHGLGSLARGADARGSLTMAADLARHCGLTRLEAWARAAHALASTRAGDPVERAQALGAEAAARLAGARGGQALALLAAGESTGDESLQEAARALARDCGLALPGDDESRPSVPKVRIRCLGGLRIEVDHSSLPLDDLRPRARQALRFLLVHAPEPVHREVMMDALWPHLPPARAASSLHVTLSSLRQALERAGGPPIIRDADAYALELGGDVAVDLLSFREASAATFVGSGLRNSARAALDLYRGDLFPEEGPAEWIVEERSALRDRAAQCAATLARELVGNEPLEAVAICERGLELDRYRDELWRVLIEAHTRADNRAAAARAAVRYDEVLGALGLGEEAVS